LALTVRQCHLIFDEVGTDRLCLSAVSPGGSVEGLYQILNLGGGRSVQIIGVNIMQCLSGSSKPSAASNDYSHRSLLKKSRGSCPGSNAALRRLRRMSFPFRPCGFLQLAVFTVECLRVSLIFRLVHRAATGPAILRRALGVGDRRSILVLVS
jgi:hypothetical protein